MEQSGEPKKLFKYYLDQQISQNDNRPLFFRRQMRWRVNSKEYATPFSKKGLLRGYIKYGILTYMAWHYTKQAFAPAHHGHGHGHGHDDHGHGHDSHAAKAHDSHGHGHDSHDKVHDSHGKGHGHGKH